MMAIIFLFQKVLSVFENGYYYSNRFSWFEYWSLGCSHHEMVEGNKEGVQQVQNPGLQESRIWPLQGSSW